MNRALRYIIIVLLFGVLVLIRFFEDVLFYDPYLVFFQNDYLYLDSPRQEIAKLVGFTALRYTLNTLVSLAILYFAFKDKGVVKFSGIVYVIAFVVLLIIYLYFVINPKQEHYYLFFNIRRFLIQPIILIVLLPAFYYHKLKT